MSKISTAKTIKTDPATLPRPSKATSVDMSVLESKIGYQMRMADRIMSRDFLKDVGMTRVQYSVLSLVATNDNLSQVDVGDALDMDRATTMAIVDKLETAGLIERQPSLVDKRMYALQLTASGKRTFPAINRKVVEHENKFQRQLSPSEQAAFLRCLWKIREA